MSFEAMRKLLPTVVRSHGISKQILSRQVLEVALAVLQHLWGEDRARSIQAVSFREGVLKLESSSAPAMQQLRVDQTRVMNEVNRRLGERCVMRLEIRSKGF